MALKPQGPPPVTYFLQWDIPKLLNEGPGIQASKSMRDILIQTTALTNENIVCIINTPSFLWSLHLWSLNYIVLLGIFYLVCVISFYALLFLALTDQPFPFWTHIKLSPFDHPNTQGFLCVFLQSPLATASHSKALVSSICSVLSFENPWSKKIPEPWFKSTFRLCLCLPGSLWALTTQDHLK